MNIQIFGSKKSQDSKKAERWFKERRIRFQYIDMLQKGLSEGELKNVCRAAGGLEALLDPACRDKDALARIEYAPEEQKLEVLLERQQVLRLPIVRNGREATVGYCPEIWETWS